MPFDSDERIRQLEERILELEEFRDSVIDAFDRFAEDVNAAFDGQRDQIITHLLGQIARATGRHASPDR